MACPPYITYLGTICSMAYFIHFKCCGRIFCANHDSDFLSVNNRRSWLHTTYVFQWKPSRSVGGSVRSKPCRLVEQLTRGLDVFLTVHHELNIY